MQVSEFKFFFPLFYAKKLPRLMLCSVSFLSDVNAIVYIINVVQTREFLQKHIIFHSEPIG